ncbi:cupin domain-containing protein [Planktothrix sp. FACHB-1365]|uniref:cupin domain-containing protein n=1 Tax=Planktothrix sp. FACHB-1365 TaxID=2692855 RepID=UPI001689233D|nr:cupin domain-containing protein [Planktothrix sp. FACHB-1365]MBD2480442.1 cupin domain-containing protein [Planktothrix sp. FACHB-1365]
MITVEQLIEKYQLIPHPEGGYFRETYRSEGVIPDSALPDNFTGDRNYCTGIYFLLPQGTKSCLHRIQSDEMWHFYLGGSMTLVLMHEDYGVQNIILGSDIQAGETVQFIVPAGWWFGGYPNSESAYSFVGCTVAPGFDFADFELASRTDLISQFPESSELILKLTPDA